MRKLFWFGCAASVTAAAFVFVTARQAHKHPASVVGQVVQGAWVSVGWGNPVFQVCRGVGARVAVAVGHTLAQETALQARREAVPCCTSKAPRCETTCEIPQVIDLTKCEQAELPASGWAKHQPEYLSPDPEFVRELEAMEKQSTQIVPVTVVVTAGDGEENETVPATMPPALDEEITPAQPKSAIEFWIELCEGKDDEEMVEVLPMPREVEEATEDKTEKKVEPTEEGDAVEQGEPPDCREMPEIDHHKSGCPSMGGCPYTGRCPTPSYPITKDRE